MGKNIIPLITKIRNVTFVEKLLSIELISIYPQFKNNIEFLKGDFKNLKNSENFYLVQIKK